MGEVTLRAPREDDWPALRKLADLSLAEMPFLPSQTEWAYNRRTFSPSHGIQQHFVATLDERIVGYGCVERRNEHAEGTYRVFVVVAPATRTSLGTMLLAKLRECLLSLGAREARMLEYEADARFISYLREMGFAEQERFNLDNGDPVVELTMDTPFQSLVQAHVTAN